MSTSLQQPTTEPPKSEEAERRPPGPLAPYWFVIVCGALMLGVVGVYVMVRFEHWQPLTLDHKIDHPKSTF